MSTAVAASSFLILLKQNDRLITKEKPAFPCKNAQDYEFAFLRLLSRVLTKFSSHGKYKLVF